jgi:RND family efflux transporter MFP subunit
MKRWMIGAVTAVGLGLVGGLGYWGYQSGLPNELETPKEPPTTEVTRCDVEQTIDSPGSVVNVHEESIQIAADGRLAEIFVRPGETVQKGQLLARLDDADAYAAALAEARIEYLAAQRALEEVLEGAPLKTAEAHKALLDAQTALETAQNRRKSAAYQRATDNTVDIARANMLLAKGEMERSEEIYDANKNRDETDPERAAALSHMAEARANYTKAKANYDYLLTGPTELEIAKSETEIEMAVGQQAIAEANWERVKDGVDSLAFNQAEARLDQTEAKLKIAQDTFDAIELTAPIDGVVSEANVGVGQHFNAGTTLFILTDPQALEVQSSVVEEEYPLIEVGMPVELWFDALPEAPINGTIAGIVPKRIDGTSPTYQIQLVLDTVPDKLVEGMSANATIFLERKEAVLCLPRAAVRASSSTKTQVEIWTGLTTEKREISVGLRGDSQVEILSGLKEGDLVVTK